jgi:hypothetical protein
MEQVMSMGPGYAADDPVEHCGDGSVAEPKFVQPPVPGASHVRVPEPVAAQPEPVPDGTGDITPEPRESLRDVWGPNTVSTAAPEPVAVETFNQARDALVAAGEEYRRQGDLVRQLDAEHHQTLTKLGVAARRLEAMAPREDITRAFLAASLEERRAIARGERPAPRADAPTPGPSMVDRAAFFGAGGSADDFARKQHQTGWRRGAYPASRQQMRRPMTGIR